MYSTPSLKIQVGQEVIVSIGEYSKGVSVYSALAEMKYCSPPYTYFNYPGL